MTHKTSRQFYIHDAATARMLDDKTIHEFGIPARDLMENAAVHIADAAFKKLNQQNELNQLAPKDAVIEIVCGPGSNGADGLAAARLLHQKGCQIRVFMDENRKLSDLQKLQLDLWKALDQPVFPLEAFDGKGEIIIDCLFGNGASRDLKEPYLRLVETINKSSAYVISADIPTGICPSTGRVLGKAVNADLTLALDCVKSGLLQNEGPQSCQNIVPVDIGIPQCCHEALHPALWIDKSMAARLLPKRSALGHKGSFGKVLLAGGSFSMQGALDMAANACFHAGCGTLTLFAPESAAQAIAAKTSLAMIVPASEEHGFFGEQACDELPDLSRFSAAGCGNGMGHEKSAAQVVSRLLESPLPLVCDADALRCMAKFDMPPKRQAPLIVTPHLAEFAELMGMEMQTVQDDLFAAADAFCQAYPDTVLVLKSSLTLVAQNKRRAVLFRPDSALSKGGSGDILCGLTCGLLAQMCDPFDAACLAVYIHNASFAHTNPYAFTPVDAVGRFGPVFDSLMNERDA